MGNGINKLARVMALTGLLVLPLLGCGSDLDSFQELVRELDEAEQEIRTRRETIQARISEYNAAHPERTVDPSSLERLSLDPGEAETLSRMVSGEQDVSYRGLLSELVDVNERVRGLHERILQLQDQLPAPYIVQSGDTHQSISVRYLVENHGLSRRDASRIVGDAALVEELHLGFRIWLLYRDDVFGTYVTQGDADVSPGRAQRQTRQVVARTIASLEGERDVARTVADSLQDLHDTLEERILFLRAEELRLQSEISSLDGDLAEAATRAKQSESKRRELEAKLNSVYYAVDTMDNWKERKVIADPFWGSPRVRSLDRVRFDNTQDLREDRIVTFDLRDYPELKSFKKVEVFPRSFKADQQYVVSFSDDRDRAFVKLLKPNVFSGQKIIFALRD